MGKKCSNSEFVNSVFYLKLNKGGSCKGTKNLK